MEIGWEGILLKKAKEVLITGGRVEFIVYKRDDKRKPVIRCFPDNEISFREIILTE